MATANPNGTLGTLPPPPAHLQGTLFITYVLPEGSVYYTNQGYHGHPLRRQACANPNCQNELSMQYKKGLCDHCHSYTTAKPTEGQQRPHGARDYVRWLTRARLPSDIAFMPGGTLLPPLVANLPAAHHPAPPTTTSYAPPPTTTYAPPPTALSQAPLLPLLPAPNPSAVDHVLAQAQQQQQQQILPAASSGASAGAASASHDDVERMSRAELIAYARDLREQNVELEAQVAFLQGELLDTQMERTVADTNVVWLQGENQRLDDENQEFRRLLGFYGLL